MRRAIIVLAVIVGLLGIVAGVGYLLPAEHTATTSRAIDAPPAAVWRAITDVGAMPEWRRNLDRVEVLSEAGEPLVWREAWERGDEVPFRETARVEGRRLVVAIDSDDLPFGGSWTYELELAAGGGTVLTITEDGEVYDPFFRFVSRFFMDPTKTMNAYLDDLDAALSSAASASANTGSMRGAGCDRDQQWSPEKGAYIFQRKT